ncbi:MAG: hypothetical protein ACHQ1G_07130 [Planctomycetota bacterium]
MLLALGLGAVLTVPDIALGDEEAAFEVVDPDGIYLGTGTHPSSPGVLVADDVWKEIPEYKKILADELTEDDAQYHLLMLKATERFNKALKALAKRDSHDMLGETGSIVAKGGRKIPDVTDELVKLVTRG